MISTNELDTLLSAGGSVVGSDGSRIGKVGQVFLHDATGKPEWITVATGLFGTRENFVPLDQAELSGDTLTIPFTKDEVKDAPQISPDQGHLSEEDEVALYRHYGRLYHRPAHGLAADDTSRGADIDPAGSGTVGSGYDRLGNDTAGPTTDDATTRSEEPVRVDAERTETGRARLRKYVVTEHVTEDVPVEAVELAPDDVDERGIRRDPEL